ncbi:hypothetical protein DH2020_025136 [Rehmannia glutinosa]|uniref:PGG domain-containing protein n=1 Tax=Rehmannia glutinosa TaxID=99300 RepID=A0ABR0W373_REHGL
MYVPKYPSLLEEEEEETYQTAETMDPKLYRATTEGDILEFARALEQAHDRYHTPPASCVQTCHSSLSKKNAKGDTALHIAARAGDSLLVTLLVNSDFKDGGLGEKNEEGNTALHEALKYGHEEAARILINKNPEMCYSLNKEGKSLLYLAAEAGFVTIVRLLMDNPVGNYSLGGKHKHKSPVFAAILGRNIDVIKLLWEKDPSSFQLRSGKGKNPLHAAQRPDIRELLTAHGQNMLHAAARSGKYKAVEYMLKMPELEKLINEKDEDGHTPLHLATIFGHPKLVGILVRDERVNLKLVNNNRQTALDIAEEQMEMGFTSFQKRLTCMALRVVGAPRAHKPKTFRSITVKHEDQPDTERRRDKINVILLVATIIATVTYTSGLTIPGGYNNINPDQLLEKVKFQEYIICDTIAMYSSIIVAVTLLWAQLGDPSSTRVALKLALLLLGIALAMMSIAFLAGVYLVVSKLRWLANVILFIGSSFIIALAPKKSKQQTRLSEGSLQL